MTHATLLLEDGTQIEGQPFGAQADAVFELVFNTSMTGYQEILTDPSYRGQGILFTSPHIGNTGINLEDHEALTPHAAAALVREISPTVSNWRSTASLPGWMAERGLPGISAIDTRWLTRKVRDGGTLKAALSTRGTSPKILLERLRDWPGLDGRDTVQEVTCAEAHEWQPDAASGWLENSPPSGGRVVLMDFGAKRNIARHLTALGHRVTIVPARTTCADILALRPDGILLSNGPGDPAGLPGTVEVVRGLIDSGTPIFGICLGVQLIGRALGAQTVKLKFGHHSANHPVLERASGHTQITSQNHNYAVAPGGLDPRAVEITHHSLNDGTVEGLRMTRRPVFGVQYHPEAAPGPHDAHGLFAQFDQLIRSR